MKPAKLINLLLSLAVMVTMLAGNAQSALLDVGPTVAQVNPSTEGTFGLGNAPLGHGFPLWYRDTNRVPLQLCTDRASGMCLTAEPNPGANLSFPTNIGDELFWWVGDASFVIPQQGALTRDGDAILVQAIEAAYSTGSPVPGAQVSFARIRIRIDTPYIGTYLVTTPYKQFTFVIDAASLSNGINFTEDIGIAEGSVFTGALNGTVGPFLYCTTAPIVVGGSSYLGNPNVGCNVLGSTFNPPSLPQPANYFRVQGPSGLDLQTAQFNIMGKLYTAPIPTPLTVDKATYALDNSGMQVNVFATTQAQSNQTGAGVFPLNFALNNTPSALEFSGTDLTLTALTTNSPADGKFFASSGLFTAPATTPTSITVTNTADTPDTAKTVNLVDEVVIYNAVYNPLAKVLSITAVSLDKVAPPTLKAYMPGMVAELGTLTNGLLNVQFPFTDNTESKTHNIPPQTITVTSTNGGSATAPVNVVILQPSAPPIAVDDAASVVIGSVTTIPVLTNDTSADSTINSASLFISPTTGGLATANLDGTVSYTAPAISGTYTFTYTVKNNAVPPITSNVATVTVTVTAPPLTITSPNGGEALTGLSTHTVNWIAQGGANNYILYYSATGGAPWVYIANVGNVTSYNWTVPNITTASASFRIQAFSGTTWIIEDVSNAIFNISAVSVLGLTSPNGGEALAGLSTHTVNWTAQGGANNYILYYSATGAAPWTYVASVGNVTSYNWSVPSISSTTARFRIQAFNGATWLNQDASDANFSIAP